MIGWVMGLFRRHRDQDNEPDEVEVKIQTERRLARLAKSEALELLFQGTIDDLRKSK